MNNLNQFQEPMTFIAESMMEIITDELEDCLQKLQSKDEKSKYGIITNIDMINNNDDFEYCYNDLCNDYWNINMQIQKYTKLSTNFGGTVKQSFNSDKLSDVFDDVWMKLCIFKYYVNEFIDVENYITFKEALDRECMFDVLLEAISFKFNKKLSGDILAEKIDTIEDITYINFKKTKNGIMNMSIEHNPNILNIVKNINCAIRALYSQTFILFENR